MRKQLTSFRLIISSLILFFLLILTFVLALSLGSETFSLYKLYEVIFDTSQDQLASSIIINLRLPRVLTAMLVGASLSIVGAVFQALLKNPLAEPYILGVSSGAALGSVLAIFFGLMNGISTFAFIGSLLSFVLVYIFGRRYGVIDPNTILLVGVMINAFSSALILFIITILDQSFRLALFWLMGNISMTNYNVVLILFLLFLVISFVFILNSNTYNLISISEENAKQFGVNTEFVKNVSFILGSLLVGIIVANVGIIGFVGLVIPHICRLIFGQDNRIVIPTSIFVGAIFLTLADLLSRIIIYPIETPIGSITAIIGVPFFIFLLKRKIYY